MKHKNIAVLLTAIFSINLLQAATKILFLGDSITEGYELDQADSYPNIIANKLKIDNYSQAQVINAGINGSITASAPERLKYYLQSDIDIMVLALGANDGLRGLPVLEMEKNLSLTIELALHKGIQVILAGMMIPSDYGKVYTQEFQETFPKLAKKYAITLIPFLLDKVATKPELNLSDGIHPNKKGQKVIATTVYRYLKPLLQTK